MSCGYVHNLGDGLFMLFVGITSYHVLLTFI